METEICELMQAINIVYPCPKVLAEVIINKKYVVRFEKCQDLDSQQ